MKAATPRRLLPRMVLAALVAAPLMTVGIGSAQAGRFHVRFHAHARARVHVRVGGGFHARFHGHVAGRWVHVRDHRVRYWHPRAPWYVGGYYNTGVVVFADPPPPPPPCCQPCAAPVPAYYQPAPPTAVAVAAAPELPRFGLGAFLGGENLNGDASGDELGVLGRFRFSRSFELEGEISKSELQNQARVDRRLGGALLWDLTPGSTLSPYLLGGLGVTHADTGNVSANSTYGELGAGLTWRLSDALALAFDIRAGASQRADQGNPQTVAISNSGSTSIGQVQDHEQYTRARLVALIYF